MAERENTLSTITNPLESLQTFLAKTRVVATCSTPKSCFNWPLASLDQLKDLRIRFGGYLVPELIGAALQVDSGFSEVTISRFNVLVAYYRHHNC
jgi:hypothetical protein